jgi:spore germination cell wall hydrolase CwlJ-like protein
VLVLFPLSLKAIDKEFECLAKNVYYESRGEPHKGQLAVALVTLNRVEDPRYPKSICGVVYQKHQFSWTKNYKLQRSNVNQDQWKKAREVAMQAYMDRDILGHFNATHFHNASVSPRWKLRKVAKINNHTFYM